MGIPDRHNPLGLFLLENLSSRILHLGRCSPDHHLPKAQPQNKLARDKAQLDLELGEMSNALHERLRSSITQAETSSTSLPSKIERLLEKDDRLLDGLQKIVPKLQDQDGNSEDLDQVEKLCHAFTILEGRAIRAQISDTYQRNPRSYQEHLF